MRRKGVPCGCADDKGCCGLKEKLAILWDRTIGSILRINGISPDGDGDFTIEAGDNINLTETGTGNGIRIDTTGGVSYYESGDAYVNVDNNDLEITVNAGSAGGLALQDDLDTVAGAVASILDGTTVVPEATNAVNATNATNATYLGSNTATVGSDTKPIKIVNGQAVAVTDDLAKKSELPAYSYTILSPNVEVRKSGKVVSVSILTLSLNTGTDQQILPPGTLPTMDGSNIHSALVNVSGNCTGLLYVTSSGGLYANCYTGGVFFCSITYIANN